MSFRELRVTQETKKKKKEKSLKCKVSNIICQVARIILDLCDQVQSFNASNTWEKIKIRYKRSKDIGIKVGNKSNKN